MKHLWYYRQSMTKTLIWSLSLYFLVCLVLWHYQTQLIFVPSSHLETTPAKVQLNYKDLWLPIKGGQVHGWWIPSTSVKSPVLLYLHGNSSNLGNLVDRIQRFHQWGYGVLLIDYRGYGHSFGPFPNEKRVYEDANTAWSYLTERQQIQASQIVIYGRSLGGAIALHLAVNHPDAAGAIVESSFTSMKAMVKHHFPVPIIPVNFLLTQKFDSLAKVESLQVPLLLIHGSVDTIVPAHMSKALYETVPSSKRLIWIEGGGHNNLSLVGGDHYVDAIQLFIQRYAN